jgi:hypothetical protein
MINAFFIKKIYAKVIVSLFELLPPCIINRYKGRTGYYFSAASNASYSLKANGFTAAQK